MLYLTYEQNTGLLHFCEADDGGLSRRRATVQCYSGAGAYRNKPQWEHLYARGPIPRGMWKIGDPQDHPRLGPVAIPLIPAGHNARGRSGFYIHGDSVDGNASKGCIILHRNWREMIAHQGIRTLEVVQVLDAKRAERAAGEETRIDTQVSI